MDPGHRARRPLQAHAENKIPSNESLAADAHQVVQDELFLDGNARQNLATFCQTWEDPEVHKIMDLAITWRTMSPGRRQWQKASEQ